MHIKPRRKLCDPKNEILGASILVLKVVVRSAFQFIIHPDVHIHLSDILMRYTGGFKVNQQKTLENIVVKDQVNIEIPSICGYMLLAINESITFPNSSNNF